MDRREHYLNAELGIRSWLFTVDHKRIALLYLFTVTVFFFLGGFFALLIRLELLTPPGDLVTADTYNKLFTMHGITMVWWFLIPSIPAILGNFLVPMMLGARDLAFPKINLASYYLFLASGIMLLYGILAGGLDTGWTFYVPLSSGFVNGNVMIFASAIFVNGFSSIFTGLNFIVTTHRMRAPGLTWGKLPLFIWAHYATSIIMVLGTPVLAITLLLVGVERLFHVGIFDAARGGDPLLFQHLFWFYSHPAVYIMILPAMGVVSEVITCFSRKRIFGYTFVAASSIGIAVLGFLVWAHHMFVAGISVYAALVFSLLSYLVAVPSAIKVFNWTATLYKGQVAYDTPMLYAMGFIGLFTIPRLSWDRCARDRHVLHRGALPLHHGGRRGDGIHGGNPLLVAEDQRAHVSGRLGQAGGAHHLHRLQPDVLPAICAGLPRDAAALLRLSARVPDPARTLQRGRFHSRRGLRAAVGLHGMEHPVWAGGGAESV